MTRRFAALFAVAVAVAASAVGGYELFNANRHGAARPAPAGSPTAEVSASASPSPPPPEALVVITQRVSGNPGNVSVGIAPDTVLLTTLNGTVVAKATFKPAEPPLIANAATLLPPQVHAAAGAAYYIDQDGVVRRLDRSGTITVVASFPTTEPQHMTAFAVSPDGGKVMATVLTFGAKGPGLPGPFTIGPSYDSLEIAAAGGPTTVLSHTPPGDHPHRPVRHRRLGCGWPPGGQCAGGDPEPPARRVVSASLPSQPRRQER